MEQNKCRLGERGASAVEFAIIVPLLLVIIFGTIDFALLLHDKSLITNASREGARAGIAYRFNYDTSPGSYDPLDQGEVESVVNRYLQNGSLLINFAATPPPAVTTLTCFTDATFSTEIACGDRDGAGRDSTGYWIEVEVTYPYDFLVIPNLVRALPGVGSGLPQVATINSITRMRME